MEKVVLMIMLGVFWTLIASGEDRLDRVPAMSGNIEVMDQLGLIDHENPAPRRHVKPAPKEQKETPQKIQLNHFADINAGGD